MSEPSVHPGFYRCARNFFYPLFRLLFRFESHGSEHVPETGGCVLVSNHASYLDPPLLGCGLKHRKIQFMARDTLFRFKPLGWWMRKVGTVSLSREGGDLSALRKAIQLLKDGKLLCLFPEGTRTHDGRLQTAKGGIGFMIAKAAVPVVPAYIDGSYEAFSRGMILPRPRKIRVYYGPPIMPDELPYVRKGKPDYDRIGELVMARIEALKPLEDDKPKTGDR